MKTTEIYQKCQELKELLATIEKYTDTPDDLVETVANAEMNVAGVISQIEDLALSVSPMKTNPNDPIHKFHEDETGLTKREHFANDAFQSMMRGATLYPGWPADMSAQEQRKIFLKWLDECAYNAVIAADKLIEQLNKE